MIISEPNRYWGHIYKRRANKNRPNIILHSEGTEGELVEDVRGAWSLEN